MTFDYRRAREGVFAMKREAAGIKERALLLALVEFAPNIEPSTTRLADMLGTSEREVRRLLKSCTAKGLLHVEHRPGQRNHYELADPGQYVRPDDVSARTDTPDTPDNTAGVPRTICPPKQTREADKKADKRERRGKLWHFVPDGWEPNDKHRSLAADRGLNFDDLVDGFRNHEFDKPKSDADRAFTNWIKRERQPTGPRNTRPQPNTGGYTMATQ